MPYANLHIGLYLWDRDRYSVNFSLSMSGNDADVRAEIVGLPLTLFDRQRFLQAGLDFEQYGKLIGQCILADPKAVQVFQHARTTAQNLEVPLRVQLMLSPKMPNIHDLHWEMLRDPNDGTPLFLQKDILFSRYLASDDTRPVRLKPTGQLRALAAIANPTNLDRFGFTPIDVDTEVARVTEGLRDLNVTLLTSMSGPVSLNTILQELSTVPEGFDVLYLVCHGAVVEGEARLWLEKPNGEAAIVSGTTLAERLSQLTHRPRLVMLISCESGGTGNDSSRQDDGALAAIGPRLALAGVPAVVAMQGKVSTETMAQFLPTFFDALCEEGQIDYAMTCARGAIQDARDYFMPVLFMRSNTGRLWAQPGLTAVDRDAIIFDRWDALLNYIEEGQCTPIIGSGLLDEYFGSTREIARRWADLYRYPMASHDRVELPQIAQFLAVNTSPANAKIEYKNYLHREILERFSELVPTTSRNAELWKVLSEIGQNKRRKDPNDPHQVLANLRCPIYITTNPDRLIAESFQEQRFPVAERTFDWVSGRAPQDDAYWPTREHPLVYYLFGSYLPHRRSGRVDMQSIVLTQDEYFQYLIAMVRNKDLIPEPVAEALTHSALLFIGFQLSDWDFRILLQSIRERGGVSGLERYTHVAVQIDPREDQFQDPEMAQRYLERMASIEMKNLSVYWGTVESFLKELQSRLQQRRKPVDSKFVGSPH